MSAVPPSSPLRDRGPRELAGGLELPAKPRPTLTATTWDAHQSITFPEWIEHGRRLGRMGRGIGWWIGDWLRFGNRAYGERYAPAARVTGYERQSLMNMVYVASRVEPARRREQLSWSHHAEIAPLEPADQDAWLDRAQRDALSVRRLRAAIRNARLAATAEQRAPDRRPARNDGAGVVCASCGRSLASENAQSPDRRGTLAMPHDKKDPTAGQPRDDTLGDADHELPRDPGEDGRGSSAHLTHAQRVERVEAHLRRVASQGIWSAIE
jgi:hypothetical protein